VRQAGAAASRRQRPQYGAMSEKPRTAGAARRQSAGVADAQERAARYIGVRPQAEACKERSAPRNVVRPS